MTYDLPLRPAAALLSKAALRSNIRVVRESIQRKPLLHRSDAGLLAMVKADAYGHDVRLVLPELERQGINFFAVASLEEALEISQITNKSDVLVLGGTLAFDESLVPLLKAKRFHVSVNDLKSLEFFSRHPEIPIHMMLDTGMNRLGIKPDSWGTAVEILKKNKRTIEGLCTHYATSQDDIFHRQAFVFEEGVRYLFAQNFRPKYVHSENSAALIGKNRIKKGILSEVVNLVRPGISLYGYFPRKIKSPLDLTPVLELVAEIGLVKRVLRGEGISYGHLYKATNNHDYGIVTLGYADGLSKGYSGILKPQWRDRHGRIKGRLDICGAICMDMVMVRVDRRVIKKARLEIGDRVVFWGRFPNEVLKKGVVEPYELNLRISKRIPRIWTT